MQPARCSGVAFDMRSWTITLAPCWRSKSQHNMWPRLAAKCRAVRPTGSI